MIALGSTEISKVCLGTNELSKVWLGSTELWSASSPLPYDAEVKYLQSTGDAYIDTGIIPTLSYSVEMEFKWVSPWATTDASGTLFGALNGWNTNTFMVVCTASNNNRYIYNCWGNSNNYNNNANYINGLLDNWHSLTFRNKTTYIDETAIVGAASGTGNPIGNIYVFCANIKNTGTYGKGTTKQIRRFKMYDESSNLVMDLIPVRKGTTGYMYDKVSKQLFGNAGTDAFVLGPDKGTLPYDAEIEYLQSTGTQYIITNTYPSKTNTKMVLDYEFTANTNEQLMGAGYSNNNRFNLGISSNKFRMGLGSTWFDVVTRDTNRHKWILENNGTSYSASIDSTSVSGSVTSVNDIEDFPFVINVRSGVYTQTKCSGKIYSLSIYKSGELVLDLIPVRVGQIGYMYDRVSGELFGNSGTGSFTLGSDKN